MSFLESISAIFKPISDVIDHLTVSGDQKAALQLAALKAQTDAAAQAASYELAALENQTKLVAAEAQGASWLQRNWRPLTMLIFVGIIVDTWIQGPPPHMSEAVVLEVFGIIKIGLGGYVGGRTVEKVAPVIAKAIAASKS